MEPQTKRQSDKKNLLHKEITRSLEVIKFTETTYRPSTIQIITKFKAAIPKMKLIQKTRKVQKAERVAYTPWEILTAISFISLLGMFIFIVGRSILRWFYKSF